MSLACIRPFCFAAFLLLLSGHAAFALRPSPPVISNIPDQTINEDETAGPVTFTVTDSDTAPGGLSFSPFSSNPALVPASNISVSSTRSGFTVTVTPAANQSGSTTIRLTVSDGSASDSDSFTVTVNAVNDPPIISDIRDQTIQEDGVASSSFSISDIDNTNLSVSGSSSNTSLVPDSGVTFPPGAAARIVQVTPSANQFGSTVITMTVSDGLASASDQFTVTVNPVNDPPSISRVGSQSTNEDTTLGPLSFTVSDPDPSDNLTLTATSSNQAVVPNSGLSTGGNGASRTLTITPAPNQNGDTLITVTVSDGSLSAGSEFNLTVNPVNDPPTISDIPDQTINENGSTGALSFIASDLETPASLTISSSSSNPTLVPDGNVTLVTGRTGNTVTVTPASGQSGRTVITITVSDGAASASDSFTVTVNPVNDSPSISGPRDQSTPEDTPIGPLSFSVSDPDASDTLTATASSSNQAIVPNSGLSLGGSGGSRTITLSPASNQSGNTSITLTVSDGTVSTSTSFTLTVTPVNDPPSISDIPNQTIGEDSSTSALPFTIADAETSAESLTLDKSSSNATLIPVANIVFGGSGGSRTVTVTPAADQTGSATITINVSDGTATASDQFVIEVGGANDPPSIWNIADQTINEDNATAALAFTVSDPETPAGSLTVSGNSSNTTLVPVGNITFGGSGASRTVTVTPASNQSGTATVTVTVSDGSATATDQFVLTVNPVNDPPTISNIADLGVQAGASTGAVPFTVSDPDTPASSLVTSITTSNAALIPANSIILGGTGGSRTVTITPAANQSGSSTITVTVSDGALTASDSFVVQVTAVVEAPKIITPPQSALIDAGGLVTFAVEVAGTAPFQYQWLFNGQDIPGATVPTHTVRNTQAGQGGNYAVRISNSAGTITSPTASLTVRTLDFGDAPDLATAPRYPTLLANNGARHIIISGFSLGPRIDAEADGQPNASATGDDLNPTAADDEDGVEFLTNPFVAGQTTQLRITLTAAAGTAGRLDAFMDFNGDGVWTLPSEQIFTSQVLSPGVNNLSFNVPVEAKVGDAFARFRLSLDGKLGPAGPSPNGEVEDYIARIGPPPTADQFDFGDAPQVVAGLAGGGYPTILASNGARHAVVAGMFLGKTIDSEKDGQPSSDAQGDDLNPENLDDEDGVEFVSTLVPGQSAQIIVIASKPGRLDAWMDFNRNQSWADNGEQILTSTTLIAGLNSLSFLVPASAQGGVTFARFRYSTNGKLNFVGPAADGEVEDYQVTVKSPAPCDLNYKGDDFWLTFPGNYDPHPALASPVSVCIVGTEGTKGKVEVPGRIKFSKDFTIPAGMSVKVTLPRAADLGDEIDVVETKGVHVTASAPVAVYGLNHIKHTSDGFLGLPVGVVGTEYIVLGYGNLQTGVSALNGTQFAFVATEDETTVTIIPSTTVLGHAKGQPYVIQLNQGQTYQLRDPNDATADLSGTEVLSDKPISLFAGHQCANINSKTDFYCDYLVEQMLPVSAWGKTFYVAPLATRAGGDTVRVLAAVDGTKVFQGINQVATLNRGQTRRLTLSTASRITSDNPVLVAQYANSSDFDDVENADPFMVTVPSTRNFTKDHMVCTAGAEFSKHYLGIVAPTGLAITIDGNPLVAAFNPIAGTGFSSAQVSVPPGTYALAAAQPFGVIVYGFGQYDSYGWPGGLYFGDLTPPTITCPPDFTVAVGSAIAGTTGVPICKAPVPDLRPQAKVGDNCPLPSDRLVFQSPAPGTLVDPGPHVITLTVVDGSGNVAFCTTTMTVIDSGALTVHCPENIIARCSKGSGAIVRFEAFASTPCGTKVPLECTPPSGSLFPLGTTQVNCLLNDPQKPQTCTFNVTVQCPELALDFLSPNKGLLLHWFGDVLIEQAPSLHGPWTPVPDPSLPVLPSRLETQQFFRIRPDSASTVKSAE